MLAVCRITSTFGFDSQYRKKDFMSPQLARAPSVLRRELVSGAQRGPAPRACDARDDGKA